MVYCLLKVIEPGNYTLKVSGIGNYKGFVNVNFTVKEASGIGEPSEPDNPSIDKPSKGDQNQSTDDKTNVNQKSDNPKTGDDTMLLGYVILMLAAIGIGGTLAVNRKKN